MDSQLFQPDLHLEELKKIAKHHSVHLFMNLSGALVLIGGFLMFIIGNFAFPQEKDLGMAIISLVISIVSGLSISKKSHAMMTVSIVAIAFIILYNGIIIRNANIKGNIHEVSMEIMSIVFLFIFLIVLLKNSYDYQNHYQITPDQTLYAWLKQEVEYLKRRESLHNNSVIKFGIHAGKHQVQWRGRLYPRSILLVTGTTIQFLERDKFIIDRDRSSIWGKIRQFFLTDFIIDGVKKYGSIDKTSYSRYAQWKAMAEQSYDNWWVPWA